MSEYVKNLDRSELIRQHLKLSVENYQLRKLLSLPPQSLESIENGPFITPDEARLVGQLAIELYEEAPNPNNPPN